MNDLTDTTAEQALRKELRDAIHGARKWSSATPDELIDAVLPVVASLVADAEALRQEIADRLLTHVGGDEADPWQAGHNYAMREAARLIREKAVEL